MKAIDSKKFLSLIRKLYTFDYALNGIGNNKSINILKKELNFKIHNFKEGAEINGWKIPKCYKVKRAIIKFNNEIILDNTNEPLGLILNTKSFKGIMTLNSLKKHLFFHERDKNAIPFHCTKQYNFNTIEWGFCITKKFFDNLKVGKYEVEINIEYKRSSMKVFDYKLQGKSKKTIVLQAHNCHPYQANDDLSGIAVGIRLIQYLKKYYKNYYTIRLIISPEITGTVFWLNKIKKSKQDIIATIILPACGNASSLKLQESFIGNTFIDKTAHRIFKEKYKKYKYDKFRRIYGNDETVFEAPGYEIPSISLTRHPYKEYHTNKDTPEIISIKHINDTFDTTKKILYEVFKRRAFLSFKS